MSSEGSPWFDSHCHIQEDPDPASTLALGIANGLGGAVLVGTTLATTQLALEVADELRGEFRDFSLVTTGGIHPHDATEALKGDYEEFQKVVKTSSREILKGIGECGLDYFYDYSDHGSQREIFIRQIELANSTSLPLVIHTRDAWDDTFAILADHADTKLIFHCFTGGPEELAKCLEFDSVVSFSGIVTFKKSQENAAAAKKCPLSRLLVETDAPYLTPVPFRGQRNLPQYVKLVGEFIADLKGIDYESVADATFANTIRAFGI